MPSGGILIPPPPATNRPVTSAVQEVSHRISPFTSERAVRFLTCGTATGQGDGHGIGANGIRPGSRSGGARPHPRP